MEDWVIDTAYLWGVLLLLPFWLFIFFTRKDFLYGMIYASLTTVLYQYLFKIHYSDKNVSSTRKMTLLFSAISLAILYILIKECNLNSIYGQIYLLLIIGAYTIYKRRELFVPILINSLLVVLLTFFWQALILLIYPSGIADNWETAILHNIYIYKIPVEELLFAFSIGFGGSFFYEVSNGKQLAKK